MSPLGHVRSALSDAGRLARVVYRDPEHVAERLTLHTMEKLGSSSLEWAQATRQSRPNDPPAKIAEQLRDESARLARIDGAIAGTPFFAAVIPGYLGFLWQEDRMSLRTAALFGHDPTELRTAASGLALRGVHPTAESAEASLRTVSAIPMPEKPAHRRSLRTWIHSIHVILIFGGFLSAPSGKPKKQGLAYWLPTTLTLVVGLAFWAITWILPLTFMIAMAWGCESQARALGRRALAFYGGEASTTNAAIAVAGKHQDKGHSTRQIVRSAALALSVAIPVAFVAYANHVRHSTGLTWLGALGSLVALSLVIATAVWGARR